MDNPPRRRGRTDTPPVRWPHELLQDSQPQLPGPASWYATSPDDRSVRVRVVWNGWSGEVAGARIWDAYRRTERAVRPTGTVAAEVRQAFAQFLADDIVAAVWPVPSTVMSPPASNAEMLALAEELLDPRILAARLVEATVQIAAVHAGIPRPVARVMGQAAGDLFLSLVSDPDARRVQAAQYVDLTLSAQDGSVLDSPALPQLAAGDLADAINLLLGLDDPTPAEPDLIPAEPKPPPPEPDLIPAEPKPPSPGPDDLTPAEPDDLIPAEPKPTSPVDEGFSFGP